VEGLVQVFGQYFVNMASVNNNITPKPKIRPKWRSNCCTRPPKRWTGGLNKVVVCEAIHGWKDLVVPAHRQHRVWKRAGEV
jgi:hypothetical protein